MIAPVVPPITCNYAHLLIIGIVWPRAVLKRIGASAYIKVHRLTVPPPQESEIHPSRVDGLLQSSIQLSARVSNGVSIWNVKSRMVPHPVLPSLPFHLTCRVPGMMRPYYVHSPTSYVYEYPVVTGIPIGIYSMSNGMLNMYSNPYYNGFGAGYRSMPVETPYSPAALALQGGKYPPTTMCVPNELAYPVQTYSIAEYNNPYRYGGFYGQRGMLPGVM